MLRLRRIGFPFCWANAEGHSQLSESEYSVKNLETLGKYALQLERNRILHNGNKNIFCCKKKTKEQKYFKLVTF